MATINKLFFFLVPSEVLAEAEVRLSSNGASVNRLMSMPLTENIPGGEVGSGGPQGLTQHSQRDRHKMPASQTGSSC